MIRDNELDRARDPPDRRYSVVLQNLPYNIDGAGVSTCAPSVVL